MTILPAVVTITDLTLATALSTAALFEAVQTTNGVIESVSVALTQIMAPSLGALPAGGNTGQVLGKVSGTNYDAAWVSAAAFVAANATSGLVMAGSTTLALSLASVAGLSVLGVPAIATAIPSAIIGTTAQIFGIVSSTAGFFNATTLMPGPFQTATLGVFGIVHGNTTSPVSVVAATAVGSVLVSAGTAAAPAWTAVVGLASLNVTGALSAFSATAIPVGGSSTIGVKLSSAAAFGVFIGTGVPSLSAGTGSLYLRSDGATATTRMYVNTNGSTTWTGVTTVA